LSRDNNGYICRRIGENIKVNEDREYAQEEIANVLAVADLKYRPIILPLASVGFRVGVVPELEYGDLN